jgi:hypothetical protein
MEKIKKEAIEHYEEMIKWAELQDPEEKVDEDKMIKEIGQYWEANYCSYCKEHDCEDDCPLGSDNPHHCCNKLWDKMDASKIWSTWITNALKVLEYIKEKG